MEVEFATSVRK